MSKVHNTTLISTCVGLITLFSAVSPASAQLRLGGSSSNSAGLTGTLQSLTANNNRPNATLGSVVNSQTTATTSILDTPTKILENTVQAAAGATLGNTLNATLQETTNTALGTIAGASTDSQTTATVVNPTQIVPALTSTLSNPSTLIQPNGQLGLGVGINNQGVKADADANLSVGVGDLAQVKICLDASASIGSPDNGSLANCYKKPKPPEPKKTPEPAAIGGLAVLGAYLFTRKNKAANLAKSAQI
ncbi:MAG TPA: PEP-CTERM sorting domain-containing protein [Nostocaceae cyanobacterium]|nr:PEP-CTERM sorting domain-containing protein [Nostocaceae cyanobacterium]